MRARVMMLAGALAWPLAAQAQPAPADPLAPIAADAAPAEPQPPLPLPVPVEPPAASPLPAPVPATPAAPLAAVPPEPVAPLLVPRSWPEVFAAIRAENWPAARAGIAALGPGPLSAVARAELYTARNSPKADLGALLALVAEAPELPAADQLLRLAAGRGATVLPLLPRQSAMVFLGSAPRRSRARPVVGEVEADLLRAALDPLVKADSAAEAELLFLEKQALLSPEARAEAGQRVAWAYYVSHRDADARRVADWGRYGGAGEWSAQASWVSALASWRLRDFAVAARSFRSVAANTRDRELWAAAHYWAARAEMAARNPSAVEPLLRAAARSAESFYGLLARETLGMPLALPAAAASVDTAQVEALPNVRRAILLAEIGETWLADHYIRHQARLGLPADHRALIAVARRLDLASAQFWLAHNGPPGAQVAPLDRYPSPRWSPHRGWRIDPALAFAHTLQESSFRPAIVSPAGAVGLMQVLPGTASLMARTRGLPYSPASLTSPALNMEYGQSFIEFLRSQPATRGQLPKVIAAYNAGWAPLYRWNYINDQGDPLLWVESIPYWETRYYVPAVMRNLWVYQAQTGKPPTLRAMAEHRWPTFPAGGQGRITAFNR